MNRPNKKLKAEGINPPKLSEEEKRNIRLKNTKGVKPSEEPPEQ